MTARGSPPKEGSGGNDSSTKRKRADTEELVHPSKKVKLEASLNLSSAEDIEVLHAIESKHEVQIHSVISSSKMRKKVTSILQYLAPQNNNNDDVDSSTAASETRISILRAKTSDIGKLISIAEIAKRELEKEGNGRGRWFQYIALGEELEKISREEGNIIIEETKLGDAGIDRDEKDDFEVMKTPFERAFEGRPRLRGVPIMSLFLSRVSIEELKKRYGEQMSMHTT
ncbi:hypothetical protein AAE478_006719 [Parahypoxylon ruwenzoriense]